MFHYLTKRERKKERERERERERVRQKTPLGSVYKATCYDYKYL